MMQLKLDEVVLGYDGNVVVEDISFEVGSGDYLCITGENGAGKTTLLKSILGLHGVMFGKITFGEDFKRTDIGYLPQHHDLQKDFPANVEEIVLSGFLNQCGFRPFYKKQEKELAKENMKKVGIEGIAKKCYRELSGGQQQRVLLARALCASSKMVLLDEPVAGLDPEASKGMYELIASLNKNDGVTVIMISHDVKVATKYCSHVLRLEKGGAWSHDVL
jgi:zinc transport system ATP-binding protein